MVTQLASDIHPSTNAAGANHGDTGGVRPARRPAHDPAYQAYVVLRCAFVVAPLLFGLDKFFNWMTYWPKYLWIGIPNLISVSPQHFMDAVGVVEMAAGLLVLVWPRVGA